MLKILQTLQIVKMQNIKKKIEDYHIQEKRKYGFCSSRSLIILNILL